MTDLHVIFNNGSLAPALLHSIWQGILVVLIYLLLSSGGLLRKPGARYAVLVIALALIPALTVATLFWLSAGESAPVATEGLMPVKYGPDRTGPSGVSARVLIHWKAWAIAIWVAGMAVVTCKHLAGYFQLYGLRKQALPAGEAWLGKVAELSARIGLRRPVRLLVTPQITVPFVMGLVKPVIMFPANYFVQLSPVQIEAILIHELTHIRHLDIMVNTFQLLVETLLFFNPAVWWLNREIRKQREFLCDDCVSGNINNKNTYLEALYKAAIISKQVQGRHALALLNNKSELFIRISRLSTMNDKKFELRTALLSLMGIAVITSFLAFRTVETPGLGQSQNTSGNSWNPSQVEVPSPRSGIFISQTGLKAPSPIPQLNDRRESSVTVSVQEERRSLTLPDTNPPSAHALELQAGIEAKAAEIEELARELEQQMETSIEARMYEIEQLTERIEDINHEREEYIEMEIENSQQLRRIEELGEELEEHMERASEQLENQLDSEAISRLEAEIARKEEEFEDFDTLDADEKAKLKQEMAELQRKLHDEVGQFHKDRAEYIADEEIRAIQDEMQRLSEELRQKHENVAANSEMLELQEQVRTIHHEVQRQMQTVAGDIRERIEATSKEIVEMQQELENEMRRHKQSQRD